MLGEEWRGSAHLLVEQLVDGHLIQLLLVASQRAAHRAALRQLSGVHGALRLPVVRDGGKGIHEVLVMGDGLEFRGASGVS